jgi:hypothetical protein
MRRSALRRGDCLWGARLQRELASQLGTTPEQLTEDYVVAMDATSSF